MNEIMFAIQKCVVILLYIIAAGGGVYALKRIVDAMVQTGREFRQVSPSNSTALLCGIPTVEDAGVIAAKMCEKLDEREQAMFIAGFQECVKYLKAT